MKADTILQTIGKTPHIRGKRLSGDRSLVRIRSKPSHPGGSIKDRIVMSKRHLSIEGFLATEPAVPVG